MALLPTGLRLSRGASCDQPIVAPQTGLMGPIDPRNMFDGFIVRREIGGPFFGHRAVFVVKYDPIWRH